MYIQIEVLHTAVYVKKKTNNNKHLLVVMCQLHSIQLQKEVKYNLAVHKACGSQKPVAKNIQSERQETIVMVECDNKRN